MLRVGLTGGIACGKSTVGKMFVELGARVIEADSIAHELMRPGESVYNEILKCFGRNIVHSDGTIDRRQLAHEAFSNGRIQELNQLVHPAVIARQEAWLDQLARSEPDAVGIVEAALILEAGAGPRFDKLVVVSCRPEQKVERFARRHSLSAETARHEVERRQSAQWPDSEKLAAADFVVDNSGSLENTRSQVAAIYLELRTASAASKKR